LIGFFPHGVVILQSSLSLDEKDESDDSIESLRNEWLGKRGEKGRKRGRKRNEIFFLSTKSVV
jgi:hypothetical protein